MAPSHRKPVIGLIGGVGSGKSTAAREFGALGCRVIDADGIGQELLEDGEVRRLLRERWGGAIFDAGGRVDRKSLAERVFKHSDELDVLNKVMQPRIRQRMEAMINQAQHDSSIPAIVIDAAIMLEAGWDDLCTDLVYVHAGDAQREGRVQERGWTSQQWQDREKSQISLDRKRHRCYFTLDNSSSVPYLAEQIRALFRKIVHDSDRP